MTIDRDKLRTIIGRLDRGSERDAPSVIDELRALGAVRNLHLGRTDLGPDERVEWFAGQALDVLESEAWFAVNSLINALDKFVPEQIEARP